MARVPHPIPYQGSKRRVAQQILAVLPRGKGRLIEPFAGSAAVTLAAAARDAFQHYLIGDALEPLIAIWTLIAQNPEELIARYGILWQAQLDDPRTTYDRIRSHFNATSDPAALLYLLARCVKASVRFNGEGKFNQSPDNRRLGMRPSILRSEIISAHALLRGRTEMRAADFRETLAAARADDVVYLDPPYQGVSGGRDRRYVSPLPVEELVEELRRLNSRKVPFVLSYDGTRGERTYGRELPSDLQVLRIPVVWGRSAQSTLSGRAETTVESLYVSGPARATAERLGTVIRAQHQTALSV